MSNEQMSTPLATNVNENPSPMIDESPVMGESTNPTGAGQAQSLDEVKSDILKIYDGERSKIMKLLSKNQSRISITTDMWTSSNQNKGYMAVTAHYIDDSWTLQSRLMRFIYVLAPHTAIVISEVLICEVRIALREWRIDPNVIIQHMATTMIAKFDKYWGVINGVMIVGTILDPRYKMLLLNYFLPRIYGDDAEYEIEKVKNMCRDLVNEYENQNKERVVGSSNLDVTNTIGKKDNWRPDFALFVNEKSAYMNTNFFEYEIGHGDSINARR
ncbi:U-box domain-containing protein 30 [Canna indica]|uniref:U-box domain-containing protein 30 n=1 Tax=Canna indica TaxID=4628 RepID=A0AAQ3QSY2_9LILI|nr:U-box domain-containing protein 30 [Canna indica]